MEKVKFVLPKAPERIQFFVPPDLLAEFDNTIKAAMYQNRSEAIREAMRDLILKLKKQARNP